MSASSNFKFYVIGVGLSRTGTLSTKAALEILLPGRCMHVLPTELTIKKSINAEKFAPKNLKEIFEKGVSDEEFKQYFVDNNIVAGVDVPFYSRYQQAMRVFPDALVLLTVRDPEAWVKSVRNTLSENMGTLRKFPSFLYLWFRPAFCRVVNVLDGNPVFQGILTNVNNGNGVNYFNNYVEEIKATVPSKRLLIFNVKDGWKPLCDALDLPIPDEDFPRVNDTVSMQFRFTFIKIISWGLLIIGVVLHILVGYVLKKYLNW